jgi:tetratricopeptide (TPR) repeat protein
MPPEQALGDIDRLDQRSDVFGLGAILCEILTGEPPYRETDGDLVRQAANASLDGAHERLRACGADDSLVALCIECLSPARRARPESAAEVAERVGAYLTSVEERARQAELRAAEARYRHRTTLFSTAATLVILVLVAGAWIWNQNQVRERREETLQNIAAAMSAASGALGQAQAKEDGLDLALWDAALASAENVRSLTQLEDVEMATRTEADALFEQVRRERLAASAETARLERDRTMLARLETLRIPTDEDVRVYGWNGREARRLDEAYAAAFADYVEGASLLELSLENALADLRRGDIEVELATSLDHWAMARDALRGGHAVDAGPTARLRDLAQRLDSDDPWRARLRALLPAAEHEGERLRALAGEADFSSLTPAGCRVLSVALSWAGDKEASVSVLRSAQEAHPRDFDLCFRLGLSLEQLDEPRWEEAVATYRIAHAVRPGHAEVLHRQGLAHLDHLRRYVEAERVFRRLDAKQPNDPHWLGHLAIAVDLQGRLEESMELFEQCLAIDPNEGFNHKRIGSAYYRRREYGKAREHFERALKLIPQDAGTHTNYGNVLGRFGDIDGSEKHQRRAMELEPRNKKFLNNLAETLGVLGQFEEAVELCHRSLKLDPNEPNTHANLGNILQTQGKAAEAIACFDRALQLDPDFVKAHNLLGNTFEDLGRTEEAMAKFVQALELKPDYPQALYGLGRCHVEKGEIQAGIEKYREALKLEPMMGVYHANLGFALLISGRPDQAIDSFERGLEFGVGPNEAMVRSALGNALVKTGRTEEAVANLLSALEIAPELKEAVGGLGAAYLNLGRLEEALPLLRRARDLAPDEAAIHNNLGTALIRSGELEASIESYRQALELDPGFYLAHLNLSEWFRAAGRVNEAIASCSEALRLAPDFAPAHAKLGLLLANQGRHEEAIASLRRAIELDPRFAPPHVNLGNELFKRGDRAAALQSYEVAHEIFSAQDTPFARQWVATLSRQIAKMRPIEDLLQGHRLAATSTEWAAAVDAGYEQRRFQEVVALTEAMLEDAPELRDEESWYVYNSACVAALLAADPDLPLDAAARARARELALTWLTLEFGNWRRWIADSGSRIEEAHDRLRHSLDDGDFASVRGDALDALPEEERRAWQELWSAVERAAGEDGR